MSAAEWIFVRAFFGLLAALFVGWLLGWIAGLLFGLVLAAWLVWNLI
jgi:hypothetical protein